MTIYRRYMEDILPLVPTVLRRMPRNIINLLHTVQFEAMDAIAQALEEYAESWPWQTAPGWLLDSHWLPYHNLQRNGQDDDGVRRFIRAKRLLNKSWGSGDQALEIFGVLLPTATLSFDYFPPKAWVVTILGVSMADAQLAITFMTKKASPQGGGFSVAGDNGFAVVQDPNVLSYSSVYGAVTITGWYSSIYGPSGSDEAGHAHVAGV